MLDLLTGEKRPGRPHRLPRNANHAGEISVASVLCLVRRRGRGRGGSGSADQIVKY